MSGPQAHICLPKLSAPVPPPPHYWFFPGFSGHFYWLLPIRCVPVRRGVAAAGEESVLNQSSPHCEETRGREASFFAAAWKRPTDLALAHSQKAAAQ